LCGVDGKDYANLCELQRTACVSNRPIEIKFQGLCGKTKTCSTTCKKHGRIFYANDMQIRARRWNVLLRRCACWTRIGRRSAGADRSVLPTSSRCADPTAAVTARSATCCKKLAGRSAICGSCTKASANQVSAASLSSRTTWFSRSGTRANGRWFSIDADISLCIRQAFIPAAQPAAKLTKNAKWMKAARPSVCVRVRARPSTDLFAVQISAPIHRNANWSENPVCRNATSAFITRESAVHRHPLTKRSLSHFIQFVLFRQDPRKCALTSGAPPADIVWRMRPRSPPATVRRAEVNGTPCADPTESPTPTPAACATSRAIATRASRSSTKDFAVSV
jgi:hypothetical protein